MKYLTLCLTFTITIFCTSQISAQTVADAISYVCPPCHDGSCDTQTYDKPGTCPHCQMTLVPKNSIKNVAVFVYDGVEILDFGGPGEVFAASHSPKGSFKVYTVAATKEKVVSQGFVTIIPEFTIEDCPQPDIIVLPGGSVGSSVNNPAVISWVQENMPTLTIALSVCNGAFILEKAGVLDGKKATTWYGAVARLKEVATNTEVLENTRWVDNGQVITTAGVSAGIDGSLRVVEKLFGLEAAKATAEYMEYDKWDPKDGVIVEQ